MNGALIIEPMRDLLARAIYEEPKNTESYYNLSEERREPWRQDADRIIDELASFSERFQEYAYERGGADWLATTPKELFEDFCKFMKVWPMKIFKCTAESDAVYIRVADLEAAKKRFKEFMGDVPASLLEWEEVVSKPDDEEFL